MPESSFLNPGAPILNAWDDCRDRFGIRPAVFSADGQVVRTFQDIEEEARRMVIRWAQIFRGARVAVEIGNSPAWPAVFLALLRKGAVTVPLGSGATVPSWCEGSIRRDLEFVPTSPVDAGAIPPPAETVLMKLTSGTTGEPRAICFTAEQLAADCHHICATMGIGEGDINFGTIPLSHSYGFSNLITPLLLLGIPLVVSEDRLPRAILHGIAATNATVFPGTPILFQHLAGLEAVRPTTLRLCISAGAPLSPAVAGRFAERFGLPIHVFYGSSECGGIAYDRRGRVVEEGFVGQPMQGVDVRSLDAEEPSLVEVRSAAVGLGYYPPQCDDVLSGGRFVPGDLIRRIAGEGLVLTGRASEFINVGGRKLSPVDVERGLAGIPGVEQVIVFGVPSPQRGEEPVACVIGGQADRAQILRHCTQVLPAWQVPRDIWILPELPINERGKISRKALAERFLAQRAVKG